MTLVCTKFNHDAKSTDYLNISIEEDTLQYIDPNLIKVISNREVGKVATLAQRAQEQIDVFLKKLSIYILVIFLIPKSVMNLENYSLIFQNHTIYA
ncbi:MAG: hypothetical protein E6364_00020 [Staphylococcus sp.]|nr:hypothetical protein [Staphylococcus sp.]